MSEHADDYQHFTNQAFRHIEQAGQLTPEQHLQAAQVKATLALAAATMAAGRSAGPVRPDEEPTP